MKKKVSFTAALLCCFAICFAAFVDISGKWSGALKAPNGKDYPITYVFKVDGNKLTGTAQGDREPTVINDGKIDGNDISFSITNQNGMVLKSTGKYYADGDSISMNIVVNTRTMHATLKRADK